jgi:hypothetical protein
MIIMLLHAFDSGSRQFLFACIVFISLCSTLQEITFLTLQWDYDEDGTLSLLEFSDLMKAFGNKLAVAKVRMYSIFLESVFHSSTFC